MKLFAPMILLLAGLLFAGCASHKSGFSSAPGPSSGNGAASPTAPHMIVTPDTSLAARVVSYNAVGRYVVLSFPVGQMPKPGQNLFLYRNGLKVGEVSISNWQRDNFVVADLITGTAQAGDEARDQ